jgi:uncharacterized membrane protein YraQ (UPF0718 family)
MKFLLILCVTAILVSTFKDHKRTWQGIKKGISIFVNLLPSLLNLLVLVAIVLSLIPQSKIVALLGKESGIDGYTLAAMIGSISLIPGFIAYPLCGILVKAGVKPGVIAVFVTTLMMVGILTLPLEAKFFGVRTALLRNGLSFIGALVIGLLMAVIL